MKKVLKFIIILFPWFLSGLLFKDSSHFYNSLNLPFFALPNYLYGIIWSILYFLIAISIYKIYENYSFDEIKSYNKILFLNFLVNQLYTFIFFKLQNLFLSFIDCLLIFITSLFLYDESKKLDFKASKYLIPYILFSLFAIILSLTIYFMNLN